MYKIIGADQKEYGPISADQLREWITQGRANAQTRVKVEGAAADWQPLSALPEFASALTAQSGGAPPSFVPISDAPKTSALAISSLALGILGLFTCGLTALVGLVLGIVAHSRIKRSQGQLCGSGLATGGIIVSAIFLLMIPVFAGLLLPALAKAKEKAQSIHCVNNVKQLELAALMYAGVNSNRFPSAATWCDAVQMSVGSAKVFLCARGDASQRSHYAFNAKLDGLDQATIANPATTVLIFESDGGWNISGGPELAPSHSRHGRTFVVGFADGHVELVREERLQQLRWDP